MLVYRLEQPNGDGPFCGASNSALSKRIQKYYTRFSHPGPIWDGIDLISFEGMKFGCKSMEALILWFTASAERGLRDVFGRRLRPSRIASYNRILLKMYNTRKMQVSVYKVGPRAVAEGFRQLAFRHEKAKLVEVIPVETLFANLPL